MIQRLLDRLQRMAARSPLVVRFAILVRNQCRCVIKYHLAESPDLHETGEVWLRDLVARSASVFVDVGANVGDWLAGVASSKKGEAFAGLAFEPSESAADRLEQRFSGDARVKVARCALGDTPGTVEFFEEDDAGKGSSIVSDFLRASGRTRSVRVATLDDELDRCGFETVDLLKIDAEGYDLRVLKGAQQRFAAQRIGVVQFEYNRSWQLAGDTLRAAYMFLERFGYRVYLLKREGLYELNYTRYEEYFEYSNFVAYIPEQHPELESHIRGVI